MTKKEFKERCSFHVYGRGHRRHNAIFFDWAQGLGFKFGVATSIENMTRAELFNDFYKWVIEEIEPSWWIRYKFASDDHARFKVPISLNF